MSGLILACSIKVYGNDKIVDAVFMDGIVKMLLLRGSDVCNQIHRSGLWSGDQ